MHVRPFDSKTMNGIGHCMTPLSIGIAALDVLRQTLIMAVEVKHIGSQSVLKAAKRRAVKLSGHFTI